MKKIIIFLAILITLLIIGLGIYCFVNQNGNEDIDAYSPSGDEEVNVSIPVEELRVLMCFSYSNYAWGYRFNGMAILNDGTIYKWDDTEGISLKEDYQVATLEGLTKFVLEHGERTNTKVSTTDFNQMLTLIENLSNEIELKYPGADQGTSALSVYNSKGDKFYLSVTGDCVGENKTSNGKKLIKLGDKYLKNTF